MAGRHRPHPSRVSARLSDRNASDVAAGSGAARYRAGGRRGRHAAAAVSGVALYLRRALRRASRRRVHAVDRPCHRGCALLAAAWAVQLDTSGSAFNRGPCLARPPRCAARMGVRRGARRGCLCQRLRERLVGRSRVRRAPIRGIHGVFCARLRCCLFIRHVASSRLARASCRRRARPLQPAVRTAVSDVHARLRGTGSLPEHAEAGVRRSPSCCRGRSFAPGSMDRSFHAANMATAIQPRPRASDTGADTAPR